MAYFTVRYYNQVTDYLHPRLHKFIDYIGMKIHFIYHYFMVVTERIETKQES